ncbi:hypothetical protein FRACYDRAFT_206563 [Fragilariopsis cylindrus CCMP1102]|uniref:Fe2OG dioxygenase domain-containing protein n=1 Tax=Fragilariopsis cylindrus CCMP1102 TaxID=635003 RepID=A0A1E7FNL5_9STRA|nr:hypothetical protein FRACYDRAFT_206563 [Fragilariopsis cylindrus CCMP1102]|eukprot:OEU19695.1 hypothetical protein FRACYDRAFT_206563 [Fragilariopsis cylindrus CCMP1102]
MIINEEQYPWLATPTTSSSEIEINRARAALQNHGAAIFPNFITIDAINEIVKEMSSGSAKLEDQAYTTNTTHTPYLRDINSIKYPSNSIYNHKTHTIVASTAYDELSNNSILKQLYNDPRLLHMVSSIVNGNNNQEEDNDNSNKLYLSNDPLGCCSVNVFRPDYYHGFHYDESEFSVTLMIQDASDKESGLFQYTDPIRTKNNNDLNLSLERTADAFPKLFAEHENENNHDNDNPPLPPPKLHTLDFRPGTLLVLAGSKSLHRVTKVNGNRNRLVAVLTFSRRSNFCNTQQTQKMFWGRSISSETTDLT